MGLVFQNKMVITRKQHICHGCLKKMPCHSRMAYRAGINNDNDFFSLYICEECLEYDKKNPRMMEFYLYDGYPEGYVEIYKDYIGVRE